MPANTPPIIIPIPIPAKTPSSRLPDEEATIKPPQADINICPSIPILMTPDRSHKSPHIAPSTRGVECLRVLTRTEVVFAC